MLSFACLLVLNWRKAYDKNEIFTFKVINFDTFLKSKTEFWNSSLFLKCIKNFNYTFC